MRSTRKVTISLPDHVLEAVDQRAKEQGAPRSAMIASALQEWLKDTVAQGMREGYLALAEENSAFAERAAALASEIVPDWR